MPSILDTGIHPPICLAPNLVRLDAHKHAQATSANHTRVTTCFVLVGTEDSFVRKVERGALETKRPAAHANAAAGETFRVGGDCSKGFWVERL